MRFLFDIGHPADIHLFKNPRSILVSRGHDVLFLVRDKDVAAPLAESLGIPCVKGSRRRSGLAGFAAEFVEWFVKCRRAAKNFKADLVVSLGSPAGAWAARSLKIPHIAFNDTETSWEQRLFYYPASAAVYTPECLSRNYGRKQIRYNGIHDLAYLRPEHFTPDPAVRFELGLKSDEPYAILRFVSWQATHDWTADLAAVDASRNKLVEVVSAKVKTFVSCEGKPFDSPGVEILKTPPARFHDVMAFADLVAGDGSTTATEAAVLGAPSLYVSKFANSLGYLGFLAGHGLLESTNSLAAAASAAERLLANPRKNEREAGRRRMLSETIDVAVFIADACERHSRNPIK